jgi:hypothetical protein
LFEVAVLQRPTKKEAEDGANEILVFGPKAIVAKSEQSAVVGAIMQAQAQRPESETSTSGLDVNKLEVLVRAFR